MKSSLMKGQSLILSDLLAIKAERGSDGAIFYEMSNIIQVTFVNSASSVQMLSIGFD